jgi:hypothetical protein
MNPPQLSSLRVGMHHDQQLQAPCVTKFQLGHPLNRLLLETRTPKPHTPLGQSTQCEVGGGGGVWL